MSVTTSTTHRPEAGTATGIDPRGPQVAAALTSVVLVAVLLLAPSPLGVALLAAQAVVFAIGATRGVQHTPYSWVFRTFVRPRLSAPTELEDPAPPRFAQSVGLGFAVVGLAGYLLGLDLLGEIAVGFALLAALLNAIFRLCLGCETYLLLRRAGGRAASVDTRRPPVVELVDTRRPPVVELVETP